VKFPEPGKVKTRIASVAGCDYATETYRHIAEKVFQNTLSADREYERIIFYAPENLERDFRSWLPGERLIAQQGRDIGERMANAIKDLFYEGASKSVIAGVDIPEIDAEIVRDAFKKLESADIVIGPAADGGYYLIGMKSLHREIFRNILWSTEKVLKQTIDVIDNLKLKYETLITLSDVDTLEDLMKFRGPRHWDRPAGDRAAK
jgi:rSAM/selenodomain-associated transferase 1